MSLLDDVIDLGSDAYTGISGLFDDVDLDGIWTWVTDQNFGGEDLGAILGVIGGAAGWFDTDQKTAGYQGKIPEYTAVRNRLQQNVVRGQTAEESPRRAGSEGDRFFTDIFYGQTPEDQQEYGSLDDAVANAAAQETAMNTVIAESPQSPIQYPVSPDAGGGYPQQPPDGFAKGGIVGALNGKKAPKFDTNSAAFKEAIAKRMYENAFAKSGGLQFPNAPLPPKENTFGNDDSEMGNYPGGPNAPATDVFTGGSQYFDESTGQYTGGPNAPATKPKFDINSPAFKEAITKRMYENAFAKSGVSLEELYRNAGIPLPDAFTGGSQTFDESMPPAPDAFTGGSQTFDESMPPAPNQFTGRMRMAQGGIVNAIPPAYLNGQSDGMADQVPAMIDNQRPASLSHGEMVIPADVVSHMGNGNSDAGAKQFYDMMDRVRKARTGNKQQGKQINPNKFMPR